VEPSPCRRGVLRPLGTSARRPAIVQSVSLILGLGLANKRSVGLFAAALVAGILLGAAIAVAFTVPDLWWQAQHQWATIAMTQGLNHKNGGLGHVGT